MILISSCQKTENKCWGVIEKTNKQQTYIHTITVSRMAIKIQVFKCFEMSNATEKRLSGKELIADQTQRKFWSQLET